MNQEMDCDILTPPRHSFYEAAKAYCSRFCVGGVSVQMMGGVASDVSLIPELVPFRAEMGKSDIHIRVQWVDGFPAAKGRQLFDSERTWRLYERADGFEFDFVVALFGDVPLKRLLIDHQFRHARLQMNAQCAAALDRPMEPLGYPLDELLIMHRLTQERAIELHGSGIVRANGVGNLFVGHSGAGKSTTTRLWTEREEVEVLSDDRIIVRPDTLGQENVAAERSHGARIVGFRDDSASRNHGFAQNDKPGPMRMYGTPWHGEAMFASPNSAPLTRIFVLEHGHGNVITNLSRGQAVGELFARSFVPFHRHEYIEAALSFLEQLADSVPCYRYRFEPDRRAVDKIIDFQD